MGKSFFAALSLFMLSASAGATEMDLPKLVQNAKPNVFLIETFDAEGKPIARGTGFFIAGPHGAVAVTNAHVIKGASKAVCTLSNGSKIEATEVTAYSESIDVAALSLPGSTNQALLPVENSVTVGESVAVLGNPLGYENTLSSGIVSGLRSSKDGSIDYVQITAPISHGSSGSPVLNASGRVIGLASLVNIDGQALNFAISTPTILKVLSAELKLQTFSSLVLANDQQYQERIHAGNDALFVKHDEGSAIKIFQGVLSEYPKNIEAATGLTEAYIRSKLFGQARAVAENLVTSFPDKAESWINLAGYEFRAEDPRDGFPNAIQHCQQALKIDPGIELAWTQLAILYH